MMKSILLTAILIMAVVIGCVPLSLNPFYSEKDLTFEPALVGLWGDPDDGTLIRIEQTGDSTYWMTDLEADSTLRFDVHLFKLGGRLCLDLYPKSTGVVNNDLLDVHLIRGHSLLRVDRIDSTLVTADLDEKWLTELLSNDTGALPHVITDDQVVLTGTTAELQAFVLKHLGDPDAFNNPSTLTRTAQK